MMLPVQITFRYMPPSDAVAARVQEEAEKLDEFYRRTMIASGVDANGTRCCGILGRRLRIQVSGRTVWIDQTRCQKG